MSEPITIFNQKQACEHSFIPWAYGGGAASGRSLAWLILTLCLTVFFYKKTNAQCTLACNDLLYVSLPAECESEITHYMLLNNPNSPTCQPSGPANFETTVMYLWGQTIPTSPFVNADHIGQTFTVKVKHLPSGNSCWGSIHINDKLPPQLTCPPDITVACTVPLDTANTGAAVAHDCSDFDLTFYNSTQSLGCNGNFAAIVTRTWVAIDEHGFSKTCQQKINIEKPDTVDVQFPPNRDGVSGPAIDCANPITSPDSTGRPTIDNFIIPNGTGFCNMAVTYADQQLPICENSFGILRTWTVISWCTGAILTHTQIIKVKDSHGPVLACPASFTAGTTSSTQCLANVLLPPVGISDDCSTDFSVSIQYPNGVVNGNGGWANGLGLGVYTLVYNVADDCGNSSTCSTQMTVVDDVAPTVVCDATTVVTLSSTGMAHVFAQTFDDGSYDNCGPITLSVRRMAAACGTQPVFAPTVKFCCADVGNSVQVQMKATDFAGNSNTCMVSVFVTDNSTPLITCPPNKTLTCLQDYTDLTLTGLPSILLNCGVADTTFLDVENLNMCSTGSITRTWKATAANGHFSTCNQTITLVDNTPVSIAFPPNYAATGCVSLAGLAPDSLPAPYNFPVVSKDCELIATNFSDQVFTIAPPSCFKIVRTWTLLDWCSYQPGGSTGIWTAQQIISVTDTTAPTFTCPASFALGVGANCTAQVLLPQVADIQDCSQSTSVAVSSPFGNGYGPFNNVGPGSYSVNYVVSDGCGNSAACSITVTVKDLKKPTPYCKDGLVTTLMGVDTDGNGIFDEGMATAWASDFNEGSFDNCPGALKFSFSQNVAETSLVFDCDSLGIVPLQIWVTDAAGNQDFCTTQIEIQDNQGVCSGNQVASVGGAVTNELGFDVANVAISLSGGSMPPVMTGADGNFSFQQVPLGGDFSIIPAKDTNLLNGVTTFDIVTIRKHILNIAPLGSPYKIIAADANRSNTVTTYDVVEIQKAILHITYSFSNNKSWRFVRADYVFPNPANPFAPGFPEVYNINNFNGDLAGVDFIAIKIGDVNNSATLNQFHRPSEERSGETLQLVVADVQMEQGNTYKLAFGVKNFRALVGSQFALQFDPEKLDFVGFENGDLPSLTESNIGFRLLHEGVLTASWSDFQAVSLPDGAVLFSLRFQAKANTMTKHAFHLSDAFTAAEAYFENGEVLDLALQVGTEQQLPSPPLLFPNPFKDCATLRLQPLEAQIAVLVVYDATGRPVHQQKERQGPGPVDIKIKAGDLPGAGTYFYQLKTESATHTGKLVLLE
jgi:hypothetical protein